MSVTWSYSSLKTFQQCPKKYYHLKVAKDIKDPPTTATLYGQAVHKAAEDFIKDGTPIPEKFEYVRPFVETLAAIPGKQYVELELGLTRDSSPVRLTHRTCGGGASPTWSSSRRRRGLHTLWTTRPASRHATPTSNSWTW